MATLNEITFDILNTHSKYGIETQKYADLHETIKRMVMEHYALYMRRDIDKNGANEDYFQTITCELIDVDKSDAECKPVDCIIKRTRNQIPKSIRLKGNGAYKFVGTLDRTITFTRIRGEELLFTYSNDFTANIPRYTYKNGYLYIYNWTKGKYISIEDIFVVVVTNGDLCNSIGTVCYDTTQDDVELAIPADMLVTIKVEILTIIKES